MGICGGYQMMGMMVSDPEDMEGEPCSVPGLGILPISTVMENEKVTRQVKFHFLNGSKECSGYEIHMGRTELLPDATPLNTISDGQPDGCMTNDGKCFGSYIHGLLDNDAVIDHIIKPAPSVTPDAPSYEEFKEQQYEALAIHLRKHIDMDRLYNIMGQEI